MKAGLFRERTLAVLACIAALTGTTVQAQEALKFADVLTDNMVLQRGKPIKIWGTAPAGSNVEVILTQSRDDVVAFAGELALVRPEPKVQPDRTSPLIGKVRVSYTEDAPAVFTPVTSSATADADGRWLVEMGIHEASFKPTYLAARAGDARIAIGNLLIGEVWIASGQSNMEWPWTRDKMWENRGLIFNGIRYAKVRGDSHTPRESFVDDSVVEKGKAFESWIVCEDGAVGGVSTLPYLFAQYLHRRLKVPVGIINIAQGGSFSREWCSRELLAKMDSPTVAAALTDFDKAAEKATESSFGRGPASLYNARLHPIRHMTSAGVIYLQGENEALCGSLPQYGKTFPGAIESYRTALKDPELPFGIITLQGYGGAGFAVAPEIHLKTHRETPNTGYIVAHDIGGNIHPTWKRPLAERAVFWALRDVYKVIDTAMQARIKNVSFEGGAARVEYEQWELKNGKWIAGETGLPPTNDQQGPEGFEIAGADRAWHRARIEISPRSPVGLVLSHPLVPEPVAVRYAWCGFPCGNLGSWEDPVPPFRSDDWPIVGGDTVQQEVSGALSNTEIDYMKGHDRRNLQLESDLNVAVLDSYDQFAKRYADPKGMFEATLLNMQLMMQVFDPQKAHERSPVLGRNALHSIPCRYWRPDRYTPERSAKWGWLIERIIRFEDLPRNMEATLENPDIKSKLVQLQKAIAELQAEVNKLPDAEQMTMDTMLDKVIPMMEREKQRLTSEGVDMEKANKELNPNPF